MSNLHRAQLSEAPHERVCRPPLWTMRASSEGTLRDSSWVGFAHGKTRKTQLFWLGWVGGFFSLKDMAFQLGVSTSSGQRDTAPPVYPEKDGFSRD